MPKKNTPEQTRNVDSLNLYLQQLADFPPLTKEEERELGERNLRGDQEARERLICCNLRLVVSIAKNYSAQTMTLQDMIQEGNTGLMRAVEKFNPTLGFRFSTYATWWIKQSILKALGEDRIIKLPAQKIEEVRKVQRIQKNKKGPIDYTTLSKQTGFDEEKVKELLQLNAHMLSLDAPAGDTDATSWGSFLADETYPSPEEVMEKRDIAVALDQNLDTLMEYEKQVLNMRYGLHGGNIHTLEEISNILGVTRERVHQIEARAILKLQKPSCMKHLT